MMNRVVHGLRKPGWWNQRTTLEKILIILALVSMAGAHRNDDETCKTCTTAGCARAAVYAIDSMDTSIEPCDDFYQFACGNFIKNTQLPKDKSVIYPLSLIMDKLQVQITKLISEESKPDEAKPFRLAKDLYKACNNLSLIEERGTKPYLQIVEGLGGWPVVVGDDWDKDSTGSWVQIIKTFSEIGFDTNQIIELAIGIDLKNSSKQIIDVDQPSLSLGREFLVNGIEDKIVKAYYDYMVDTAVIHGANREVAEVELLKSLEFEIALAHISLPQEERRDASLLYHPTKLSDIQKEHPYINWVDYCNALLPEGVEVNDDDIITISVPSFFTKLGTLLEETPKRTIANYLIWRVTEVSTYFMGSQLRKRNFEYTTTITGNTEEAARWKECVDITTSTLAISVGALYVKEYFEDSSKSAALEIVDNIRDEFEKILRTVDWMDEETRVAALGKLAKMAAYIGYPDEIKNVTLLEEYYDGLEIDPEQYFESFLKVKAFKVKKNFGKLWLPVNKTEWDRHAAPADVNAYYSPVENSIQFPAGILQGQLFSADRPNYMNYAGIGFIFGHEITHGFDDKGRQFDGDGSLVEWWDKDTIANFQQKAQCIIEQYGNYTHEETMLSLNGINTVENCTSQSLVEILIKIAIEMNEIIVDMRRKRKSENYGQQLLVDLIPDVDCTDSNYRVMFSGSENIADNGGILEAYLAYQKWVANNGEEPILPGLDFNPNQLFWLSAVQSWCSVERPEYSKLIITTNEHPLNVFRMRGILHNMPEFSNAFNCPAGSPMNPINKCKVW